MGPEIYIYGKKDCGYCTAAKTLCEKKGISYQYMELGKDYSAVDFVGLFPRAKTFPQIVLNGRAIGGYTDLREELG